MKLRGLWHLSLSALALLAQPWTLSAATITVTSLGDDTVGDGEVTLREAILAANSDSSVDGSVAGNGPDEIVFATSPGTITLGGTALPTISDELAITGPGASQLAVDASGLSRVFEIGAGTTVLISGLTVGTGYAAAANGGGIFNEGDLTLSQVLVSGNTASGGDGGGIHNIGTLQVTESTITTNSGLNGGGIFNEGTLVITDSTLSDNFSDGTSGGGGLLNENGDLTVTRSTISGNGAVSGGGVASSGGFSVVTIANSTISGNDATNNGGGITNFGGSWTITHGTITGNLANSNGDLVGIGGGIKFLSGTLVMRNTIVAQNMNGFDSGPDDVNGAVEATSSYNLVGVGTGLTGIVDGANGNQIGSSGAAIDPELGFLQDNGGPTLTHELLDASPANDAANFIASVAVDQRGITRPQGLDSDIGAFEIFVPSTVPFDLHLQDMSLDSVETFEACNSISAGPSFEVGSSGAITFRAGIYVALHNGLSVLSDGEFTVLIVLPSGCS